MAAACRGRGWAAADASCGSASAGPLLLLAPLCRHHGSHARSGVSSRAGPGPRPGGAPGLLWGAGGAPRTGPGAGRVLRERSGAYADGEGGGRPCGHGGGVGKARAEGPSPSARALSVCCASSRRKGLSQSALPYRRSVPTVSSFPKTFRRAFPVPCALRDSQRSSQGPRRERKRHL